MGPLMSSEVTGLGKAFSTFSADAVSLACLCPEHPCSREGGREGGEGSGGRGERKVEKKTLCQKKTSLVCLMCHYVRLPSGPG